MKTIAKEILDTIKFGNWNFYREKYNDLTFSEKKWLHENWQQYINHGPAYNLKIFIDFFNIIDSPCRVVELGCGNRKLEEELRLRYHNIIDWSGVDIVDKYSIYPLTKPFYRMSFFQNIARFSNVFIASHVLEHMNLKEVKELFEVVNTDWLIFELPLSDTWDNYNGAHILTIRKEKIKKLLEERYFIRAEESNIKDRYEIWDVLFERRKG